MADDFEHKVADWLNELDGELATAGSSKPAASGDGRSARPVPPVSSPLPPRASPRPAGLAAEPDPPPAVAVDTGPVASVAHETAEQQRLLDRTEALVAIVKTLASEVREVRRDHDEIKAILVELRRLVIARKPGGVS